MFHLRRSSLLIAGIAVSAAGMLVTQPYADDTESVRRSHAELPQPVVDTHDLMELFNQPLFKYLKEAMKQEPSGDEGWSTLQERGLQAAEVMNLVAMRDGREAQHANWKKHVRTAYKAGLQLNESAKARDWQKTQAAYQRLVRNCNECHQDVASDHAPQIKP